MKLPPFIYHPFFSFFLLLTGSLFLYISTFNASWLMDDYSVIVNNTDIRSIENFINNTVQGRPLREISYLLDYKLFKLDSFGYHFQNIFWHAVNCWLVYQLAIRLNQSKLFACLSSLLFLVHPIHVEVVANTSHRKDSLALVFLLSALLCYIKIFDYKSTYRRFYWLILSLTLWGIAFMAKGNALVFPVIALIYEYALVSEENRLIVRWNKMIPTLGIISALTLVIWYFYISTLPSFKMAVIGAFVKTENLADFSTYSYILMVLKSFTFMLLKLILPLNLSMEYIYAVPKSSTDIWVLVALLLIPVFFATSFRWKKTSPELFFLLICTAALWFPTANIVWHFAYFAADRYMYAPSAGLCIIAVQLSKQAFSNTMRFFIFGWVLILSVFALLTYKQANVWHNEFSLYSNMLTVSPRSLEAMIGLANAYYHVKDYENARKYAKIAMERDFTDYRPYLILGNLNFIHGKFNEALQLLLEAKLKNNLAPEVHNTLGSVYDELGKFDDAIDSFKKAIKLRPDYLEAYTNIGVTYERINKLLEAETALNKALLLDSSHVPAWYNLGVVKYKQKDNIAARFAFYEAVKLNSYHIDAITNLSIVCKEIGDTLCYKDAVNRMTAVRQNDSGIVTNGK